MSSTIRKVDQAIAPDHQTAGTVPATAPGTVAPGGAGNAYVDNTTAGANYTGTSGRHAHQAAGGMVQSGALPGPAPNTAGPHRHDILNKIDPTVDSTGRSSGAVAGTNGAVGTTGVAGTTATGHHNKNHHHAAEVAIPAAAVAGAEYHHHNKHHHHDQPVAATTAVAPVGMNSGAVPASNGPHRSNLLNKLDPAVDSNAPVVAPAGNVRRGI